MKQKHNLTWQVCSWEPRRMFDLLQTSTAVALCFQRKPLQFWEVWGGIQQANRRAGWKTLPSRGASMGRNEIRCFSRTGTNSSYRCFPTKACLGNWLGYVRKRRKSSWIINTSLSQCWSLGKCSPWRLSSKLPGRWMKGTFRVGLDTGQTMLTINPSPDDGRTRMSTAKTNKRSGWAGRLV